MKFIVPGICLFIGLTLTETIGSAQAQVVPAPDTGTIVMPDGNRFEIGGGRLSGDRANLFHSLHQFGLSQDQIAVFLSNPSIHNILVRVTGGEASRIDGLIRVANGNSNLFLMNPAGILFGSHAQINVPGSFTATTANGIGFGSRWFSASGSNHYEALNGTPDTFAFTIGQPGAIINAGVIQVGVGQQLNLIGGTVISTGSLIAPDGNITIAAVPGGSFVRLTQAGSLLNLELQRPAGNLPEPWTLPVLALPQLLTGGNAVHAQGVLVDDSGQVRLVGSGIAINSGDVTVRSSSTQTPNGTLLAATNQIIFNPFVLIKPPPLPGGQLSIYDCNPACPKAPGAPIPEGSIYNFSDSPRTIILKLPEPLPLSETENHQQLTTDDVPPNSVNTRSPINPVFKLENDPPIISSQTEEIRQYFQKRWNRLPQFSAALQYRLLLNAQGQIEQIVPIGQMASAYVARLELPAIGQPFVSPSQNAQSFQVIVTLNPDGRIDVFSGSVSLKY